MGESPVSARPNPQSDNQPRKRILYSIDPDSLVQAVTVDGAPMDADPLHDEPVTSAPIESAPVVSAPVVSTRADGSPVFRIEHPLYEADKRAEWLVDELLASDSIFDGRVHVPTAKGGKKGPRPNAAGAQVTHATFTSIIGQMLHHSPYVQQTCLTDEAIAQAIADGPNSVAHQKVEQGGQLLARLFLHYWRAVAHAFPQAWEDPHDHLLWHPHGLTALARLGAQVVEDQVRAYDISQHYFDAVLERIAESVSLAKADYADIPAREVSDYLFQKLSAARAASATRRGGLMAVPGDGDGVWGSAVAPRSVADLGSAPLGAEN